MKKPNYPKGIWPNNQKKSPKYSSKHYNPKPKKDVKK